MKPTEDRNERVGGRLLVAPMGGSAAFHPAPTAGEPVTNADVLIAGADFGKGGPDQMAQALVRLGIRAVVAESYDPRFVEQARAVGLLLAESHYPLHDGFEDGDCVEVDTRRGHLRDAHGSAAYPLRILNEQGTRSQVA
jgi:3-isopropylmalate dehydratase small subunit